MKHRIHIHNNHFQYPRFGSFGCNMEDEHKERIPGENLSVSPVRIVWLQLLPLRLDGRVCKLPFSIPGSDRLAATFHRGGDEAPRW